MRLIDYYENEGEALPHYIKVLRDRPYVYEEHFAPHDIEVRELSSGRTRREIAIDLGIIFTVLPKLAFDEGIEMARDLLPQCWFDAVKCERGIRALMHYQKRYVDKTSSYTKKPLHNWASHGADAFRYLAMASDQIMEGRRIMIPRVVRSLGGRGTRKPRVLRSIGV
jgi:hypothetical protein